MFFPVNYCFVFLTISSSHRFLKQFLQILKLCMVRLNNVNITVNLLCISNNGYDFMLKLLRNARRRIARIKNSHVAHLSTMILPNSSCPVLHASVYLLHREKKEWQRGNVCRYSKFVTGTERGLQPISTKRQWAWSIFKTLAVFSILPTVCDLVLMFCSSIPQAKGQKKPGINWPTSVNVTIVSAKCNWVQ